MKNYLVRTLILVLIAGCANRVVPTGGTKDILPPVVQSIDPPQRTRNLTASKITITFDEYVQLKELNKQLVISPIIHPTPRIYVQKKSVIIELPDSLQANTTYSINFGNSIADNNEGNPLPQFRYIFSTGNDIDSLKIKGKILNAETGKPEKNALAIVYKSTLPDSLILKTPPDYFTRAAEDGTFTIENIHQGKYRIYALIDNNNNYILDPKDENAGFESMPFELKDTAYYELRVAKQPFEKQLIKPVSIDEPGKLVTTFSKPLTKPSWKFVGDEPTRILSEISSGHDTVSLYSIPAKADSVKVIWYDNELLIDTVVYKKAKSPGKAVDRTFTTWKSYPAQGGVLKGDSHPFIKWSVPVISFDSSLIKIKNDTIPVPFTIDFTDSIKTQMLFTGKWAEGVYTLKLNPKASTDFYGRTNDTVVVSFTVPGERTTGSISFKLNSKLKADYILQLVNEQDEVCRQRFTNGEADGLFEMVDPGIYRLRIINDKNNNHRWDSGDVKKGIQPEEVEYHLEKLTVRANWEVETIWNR